MNHSSNNHSSQDWNYVWNRSLQGHLKVHGKGGREKNWDKREEALAYWKGVNANRRDWLENTLRFLPVSADSRVLDIGTGPGNLAIPLATRTAEVTVVEPARGMRMVLEEMRRKYMLGNITCIPKRWEDVDLAVDLDPPYDVVIAAFSLTIFDIRNALQKMHDAASGSVIIDWFIGEPGWEAESRWLMPLLRGEEYTSLPKCDVLLAVMEEMGIRPHTEIFSFVHTETYDSIEEAVRHYACYYGVEDRRSREIIRRYLEGQLQSEGKLLLKSMPVGCLRISWNR